jgi:polar amino acid transport system permease protein
MAGDRPTVAIVGAVAGANPSGTHGLALVALLFAALCEITAFATAKLVRGALSYLSVYAPYWEIVFWLTFAATAALFWPAGRSLVFSQRARQALSEADVVASRIHAVRARDFAYLTFGWGAFALLALGGITFVLANDVAVGRTFFFLPLMLAKWNLVVKAFWNNLYVFVAAEVLVLVWGLVVAIARLLPGPAGRPIRGLAIIYCDVFRGLPTIVVLYLVGFGLPLSGLIPAEIPGFGRVPLTWFCILALTLTYGAYVAEVYRAGIESIHASQFAAARSLGLSYFQTLRYVIVPQAVRRIIAPLLNDFIGLQKDTALVQVIGVVDAFNQSRIIASNAFNLSAVTIVAILFVLVTIPQARFVDRLVERDNARLRAGG